MTGDALRFSKSLHFRKDPDVREPQAIRAGCGKSPK
jgi:hypothetical protein